MGLIPFPKEPDAGFARELYASVEPIIAGCRDDEWRSRRPDLIHTKNPDFARRPWTNEFVKIHFETRMQLAIAFIHLHAGGVSASDKKKNPRLYGLRKFLYDCPLEQWIWHEVDLRAGAMPIPPDMRSWELAQMLADGSEGFFTLVTPKPAEIPMPRDHVYIRARQWYEHTCMSIAQGLYLPPEDEKT